MNTILLGLSILLGAGKNVAVKAGQRSFRGFRALAQLNAIGAAVSVGILLLWGGRLHVPNLRFLLLAAGYAGCTFASQALYAVAAAGGSATVSAQIYSFGFVLPTAFGLVWYREPLRIPAGIAVGLMAVSLILSAPPASSGARRSLRPAFGAMACSGAVGILQKIFRNSADAGEASSFLLLSFLLLAGLSALCCMTRKAPDAPHFGRTGTLLAVLIGCCTGVTNRLNLFLSGVLPSILFFPAVNGGCVLLTGVLSAGLLHERLTHRQMLGIGVGVAALACAAL